MSNYSEFFLNSASAIVQLELLEISHPNFSQTYRIVRNAINGVTVTLEDLSVHAFTYYPLSILPAGASDDLDQTLKVNLGDLGQILPQELDAIFNASSFNIKPTLIYRSYRSDNLAAPLNGPIKFQVNSISFNKEGATLEASAPRLNLTSTGERYNLDRFPMLKGFL